MRGKVKQTRPSKPRRRRPYDSTRRRAQAAETRQQILSAARALFTVRGYAGATMQAIAGEAGVSVETVYAGFGTKRDLLRGLLLSVVLGDPPVAFLDRPEIPAVIQERDQRRQIALFVRTFTPVHERAGDVWAVIRAAEKSEPTIAALVRDMMRGRLAGMSQFVTALVSNGPLRAGVTPSAATEIVWTLTSPEVHRLLRVDRGWSAERYEQWLIDSLERLLVD
ncbi:MAG TPA: helix-turn-helix domain-containing protein [Gemmatimonadaceae bacterium]|nr:helix-turn-helix domain-containing protein [Gemmatimonadaceae bacterium]